MPGHAATLRNSPMTRETSRITREPGKPASGSVLALNGRSVTSRGVVTPLLDRAKDGILNAPSFLYSEDRPGAIFGFFHVESLTARSNPEERQAGLHRHPDFDQLLILATGTCLFEHDGQKREVEAPCCVYTPANVVHQFSYGPDATGVVISVSSDFVAGLSSAEQSAITTMLRLGNQRVIKFRTDETTAAARALIDLTLEKFASRHPHRCDIVRYLFGGLLLELAAALDVPSHWDTRTVNAIDIFRQYRDLIQETIGAIGFSDDPTTAFQHRRVPLRAVFRRRRTPSMSPARACADVRRATSFTPRYLNRPRGFSFTRRAR